MECLIATTGQSYRQTTYQSFLVTSGHRHNAACKEKAIVRSLKYETVHGWKIYCRWKAYMSNLLRKHNRNTTPPWRTMLPHWHQNLQKRFCVIVLKDEPRGLFRLHEVITCIQKSWIRNSRFSFFSVIHRNLRISLIMDEDTKAKTIQC